MISADLLAAEPAEALLLLEGLVMAERAAAHSDRQARRLAALHVDVTATAWPASWIATARVSPGT